MAPGYRCHTCQYRFSRLSDRKRHILIHEKDVPFECNHCDFISKRKDSLKRHIENYHNQVDDKDNGQYSIPSLPIDIKSYYPESKIMAESAPLQNPSIQPPIENHQIVCQKRMAPEQFDNRLQLPHNFIYAGATQSVCLLSFNNT